ncbi:MAG: T9SS type A sorting domain-containing protein [Flavobacteriales bacterium]|nr:T9SS type A sorting domain-containing protein [Flavobacteriales bacterium]
MRTCTPLLQAALLTLLLSCPVMGQVAYPPHVVQNVNWTSGTHHVGVSPQLLSPGSPGQTVTISGDAVGEFVSGTAVRLAKGFHAGTFTGNGYFHAWIDESLAPGPVAVIAPDPDTHVQGNVLHVNKWEKLEIGLQLPQDYQDAIDRFFAHYYADPNDPYVATPGNVDPAHDLNPYADDSLQLVMTLTRPDGSQTLKWGFFMREAEWGSNAPAALLVANTDGPLHPYHIRFRMAPDMEGEWQFTLSITAPHTFDLAGAPLAPLQFTGYAFTCDPPLPDNHGPLRVNEANRRTLQFEDGTAFFGLGTNMADTRISTPGVRTFCQRDFYYMQEAMEDLHEVGGNFMRMYLMRNIFAPEWVNLGIYDAFKSPDPCSMPSATPTVWGNCQYQCWAFDQFLDKARASNIYVQLCIDPYPPITVYENFIWGNHAYMINFVEPYPQAPPMNKYDLKRFFFKDGDPAQTASGVFYYWKRKYKYIMSRWGYSVNIAAIEPFNEIDQMLSYQTVTMDAICDENDGTWNTDPALPATINQWITDIAEYVRGPVDLDNPVTSPLGEDKKLFLMSYTDAASATDTEHYLHLTNPQVDLMSVHKYAWPDPQYDIGQPDSWMKYAFDHVQDFWNAYPSDNAPLHQRKPFTQGETNYWNEMQVGGWKNHIEKIFHNYDVSFHNELWSSAFSGKFAAGTTWLWERVFWWPDALPQPPSDPDNNEEQIGPFSNVLGATNNLDLGLGIPIPIQNRTLHHHFKPLADLLYHPSWLDIGFFNSDYTANKVFDESNANKIEGYYLKSADSTVAIGWVHNRNAWVMNSYYLANTDTTQNFFGCTVPSDTSITLTGFLPSTEYHISWFPTRMDSTVLPMDTVRISSGTGTLLLDLSTAPFGDIIQYYLDTLRADYAFIITPEPFEKSMQARVTDQITPETGWDFFLYPNPARDALYLRFQDDAPKDITVLDVTGRQVAYQSNITAANHFLSIGRLAKGAYWVRVADSNRWKVKKLIVH